jgi:hypothetical protein
LLSLADTQAWLRCEISGGRPARLAPSLFGGRAPSSRLAIYRRNYEVSLLRALMAKFPATHWLLGDGIFAPVARDFAFAHPPRKPSLAEYAEAARQSAKELGVAFIDLNALSIPFYEALEARGPEFSRKAFAGQDNTHHDNYGSYELAKAIVQSIRNQKLPLGKFIVDDFKGFDPAHPDDAEQFALPASPNFTNQRPLGDEPAPK